MDLSKYAPYIVAHKRDPTKVYCRTTKITMKRDKEEIEKHLKGRRFKYKLSQQTGGEVIVGDESDMTSDDQEADQKEFEGFGSDDEEHPEASDDNENEIEGYLQELEELARPAEIKHSDSKSRSTTSSMTKPANKVCSSSEQNDRKSQPQPQNVKRIRRH